MGVERAGVAAARGGVRPVLLSVAFLVAGCEQDEASPATQTAVAPPEAAAPAPLSVAEIRKANEAEQSSARMVNLVFKGKRLHTVRAGPSSGLPVVLLHGARFDANTWQGLGTMKLLADAGFLAIAVDLPGHGLSDAVPVPPPKQLAAILALLKVDRPVLVAPSASGKWVWAWLPKAALRGFVGVAPVGAGPAAARLKKLRVPTLLVWGERDQTVPLAQARKLQAAIRGSKLVVLPGAGHASYEDAPAAFHQALLAFLLTLS